MVRARALVGTRFVAQGRDPAVGLDCVGLALLAYDHDRSGVSDDYRLSGAHRRAILDLAKASFRRVARSRRRAGDLLMLCPGTGQWHLAVWTGNGVIHADIVQRKIVERPGPPDWPIAAVLRPRARTAKGG
ncbi:MAG: peptidoglycan endopeptidase [Sphingomonas sp.]|nr:peptidoglycan endopeptidase [Sphingomonas sp.]